MGRAHEVRAASMAKTAAAKSSKYAKWGKEIFLAAKVGVADPEMNQSLKRTIERAKKDQCPADVIKRAIIKAQGVASGASKEKIYEGYGTGNVAVIVECLTDNDNRTFTEVRTAFNKTGGNVGTSVSYLFNRKAQFIFDELDEDEAMEALMAADCDCEEIKTDEDGYTVIISAPADFEAIRNALLAVFPEMDFEVDSIDLIPSTFVDLDEEHEARFKRMLGMLREIDDVQEIYHNANLSEDEE